MLDYKVAKEMERAISLLVRAMNESGKNQKPVIVHSILVGLDLVRLEYPLHVVQAGILHDVAEDSDVKLEEIKSKFGDKVASIVAACTYNHNIQDKTGRYKDAIRRAVLAGKEALVVMAADFIQNEPYYKFADSGDLELWLKEKLAYFIDAARPYLENEPIWKDLELMGK